MKSGLKTIFIPIFQGVEARNVLRTDVVKKILEYGDSRVVFFVSSSDKKNYYEREFGNNDNMIFEVFNDYKPSFLERFLGILKVHAFRSKTMDNKRLLELEKSKNSVRYYRSLIWNRFMSRPLIRYILRFLDYYFVRKEHFRYFFEKHHPDLVFLGHLFGDTEVAMLREAKRRSIPSVGLVNSWDKLTSRCMLRILPGYLFVPNGITYEEANAYHDVPYQSIVITGAPQFDMYFNRKFVSRDQFCRSLNIREDYKIILVCPIGKTFSTSDWRILELLEKFYLEGKIPTKLHFVVRFPPNDIVEEKKPLDAKLFTFQKPGIRFSNKRGVDWDFSESDLDSLGNSVASADLIIPFWSTMNIDGAILDKPLIAVDFDIEGGVIIDGSFYQYQSVHYKKIKETGAVTVVKDPDMFCKAINYYLEHPDYHRQERYFMVKDQLYRMDGKAGEYIASLLRRLLFFKSLPKA